MKPLKSLLVALALVLPLHAWAQVAGTGQLTGRVTTTTGDALPGVTVTLDGNGPSVTTVTGADGRFMIETIVDGAKTYRLKAALAGFQDSIRTRIRATPGDTTVLPNIALRLGCAAPDLVVNRGFTMEAPHSALVAHLRIETVATARGWQVAHGCVIASEARAFVVADEHGGSQRRIDILVPARYEPGEEGVFALTLDPVAKRYTSWGISLPVANGIATLDEPSVGLGLDPEMPVNELLDFLARLKPPI